MTGDGVNDAPALKKADCGIAVSGATDAARAAAAIVLMTPGLSVIIDAIKESRKIFQRMNSYAIYRIAETLRVLLFMTLAILIFNFYPLTAVMIVMLALLNDGAILSIAYDNVHYKDQPEAWNMRLVLGIATVLGVVGAVAAFGLFYLGDRVFHLDRRASPDADVSEAVGGRTSDDLPDAHARPVLVDTPCADFVDGRARHANTGDADCGLWAVHDAAGWGWAVFVWGYALAWFLVNDRVKLLAYRILDPHRKLAPKLRSQSWDNISIRDAATAEVSRTMKIDSKDFRVREGDEVDLKKWPTKVDPVYKSKEQYKSLLEEHVAQLSSQQQLLYASNRHAVLLIFQAMDAAGKDGAIRHVMSGVNPQGCQVFSFKHPSATELEHDFLWRTTRDLPERGRIGIFNRSYYEEVLIVRVHPEILRSEAIPDDAASRQEGLARPVSFDRGFGETPPRQRNPHHQVLPPPLEGGTAKALSGAHRRAGQELEIQPGRHRGAKILEAVHEGLRGMPQRDKHRARPLVCRSRRRQRECSADRVADCSRYARRTQNGLPEDERKAPARIAVDPQAAREVKF